MNFEFSEEQLLLRTSVRGFLEREWPAAALRRAWESDEPPSALWPKLGSLGVTAITLPEASGGLGGDELDLVLALEECGRAALPLRVGELAAAAGLLAAADNDLARAWLPKIADGSATLALGLAEQPYVAGVSVAGLVLLEVEAGVCAVAPDRCRVLAQPSFAPARDLASLEVEPGAGELLQIPGDQLRLAWDRCTLAAAAELVGASQRMLEQAIAYAEERHQFGRAIGSFQAVKHRLVDSAVAIELARPAVYAAAWAVARGRPGRSASVSLAKLYANRAAIRTARDSLQVHGGIGFAAEYDLQLWIKHSLALSQSYGAERWHLDRLAEHLGL